MSPGGLWFGSCVWAPGPGKRSVTASVINCQQKRATWRIPTVLFDIRILIDSLPLCHEGHPTLWVTYSVVSVVTDSALLGGGRNGWWEGFRGSGEGPEIQHVLGQPFHGLPVRFVRWGPRRRLVGSMREGAFLENKRRWHSPPTCGWGSHLNTPAKPMKPMGGTCLDGWEWSHVNDKI